MSQSHGYSYEFSRLAISQFHFFRFSLGAECWGFSWLRQLWLVEDFFLLQACRLCPFCLYIGLKKIVAFTRPFVSTRVSALRTAPRSHVGSISKRQSSRWYLRVADVHGQCFDVVMPRRRASSLVQNLT